MRWPQRSVAEDAAIRAFQQGFGAPGVGRTRVLGLALAVLLHLLLLWLILAPDPLVIKPPKGGTEEAITYIAPLADASEASQATPPRPKPLPRTPPQPPQPKSLPVARKTPPKPPKPPTITPPAPQLAANEPLTPAPAIAPQPDAIREAPADDFSTRIEAARKRRAEAQAQDPSMAQAAPESDSQRANRIARDNIAFQQRGQGVERDQTGGVFQLRDVRTHSAEFMFRGWNPNFRRNSSQLVAVEQGSEPDIENAIVKRMINLIRTHKSGEFVWESHRLGRQITLNADPTHEGELRQFLIREFFPTYVRSSRG